MWRIKDLKPVPAIVDFLSCSLPVKGWGWVSGRLTDEADRSLLGHLLIFGNLGDLGWTWREKWNKKKLGDKLSLFCCQI